MDFLIPTFAPATETFYVERQEVEEAVRRGLRWGGRVVLSGPRRSGKTSLLLHVRERVRAEPDAWLGDEAAVVMVDAQAPDAATRVLEGLVSTLPPEQRPGGLFIGRRSRLDDDDFGEYLELVLEALRRRRRRVLLLIDEVDLPLRHGSTQLWKELLGALFASPVVRLVVTSDALFLDDLLASLPAKRVKHVEMARWDAAEIRRLIERTSLHDQLGEGRIVELSEMLAPAWPMEITLLLRHLVESGVPAGVDIGELLDRRTVTEFGVGLVDRALGRFTRGETRRAVDLLTSITEQEAVAGRKPTNHGIEPENLARLFPVLQDLVRAGVLSFSGRTIVAATPVMLHALRSFLGF